ncbi:unnamed protein product [Arabidopsis thaliana]|uniref:(thale cress) hypothetical protein n=1 Tax=Arabidopsis thaliana TaxID=3702 RepID=A0A7G2FDS7_ARATH|nr:unnamed protein product [Arabidopsis thaliana]
MKDQAKMAEDLKRFLSYPWARLSFEMMMIFIKEREVEQLSTTCVAVQGLLYALQLVVLEASPAIQESPQIDEFAGSDSDEEAAVEVGSRQGVALKLGNAKDVDAKCEYHVDPIIFPDSRLNPEEDLTWSDDEDDVKVENIVKMAEEGKKTPFNARSATSLRRKHQSPIEEEGAAFGEHGPQPNKEAADADENANPVSSPESKNKTADANVNPNPPSSQPVPMQTDFTLPSFHGDQAISAVDDVVSFYNSVDVPDGQSCGGTNFNNEKEFQGDVEMGDDITTGADDQANLTWEATKPHLFSIRSAGNEKEFCFDNILIRTQLPVYGGLTIHDTTRGFDVAPDRVEISGIQVHVSLNPVIQLKPSSTVSVVVPPIVVPIPLAAADDFPIYSSQHQTRVSEEDFTTPHKITILDSNIQLRRDSALYAKLQPLAAMLPYLFKQSNSSVGPILLHPFPLDRLHSIPQVSSPFDFVFSLFSSYMLMLPVRLKNA